MNFFLRLKNYYEEVGKVLRGEAQAASIFPNATDKGMAREHIYAEFLRQHAPSKCNVFFGGFVFGEDGSESTQLDVLITSDSTAQFNFHNKDGNGKSFAPVEGTLGIASIKSKLDKKELEDSLVAISKIPKTSPLEKRINPMLEVKDYDNWPLKIIYASDGIEGQTLLSHIDAFYLKNQQIPNFRKPDIIHVAGKYVIFRPNGDMGLNGEQVQEEKFYLTRAHPDLQAIMWTLHNLQSKATVATHILFSYGNLINKTAEMITGETFKPGS